ncbi:putative ribonuclease H-like domain-containing protein [Tanacetum coccineum]|uniref:Ribonuclease H-like domain-containing protein n=1 Tax=Tanacetum coccineum TaxID=301880 RepID=A0ABQ5H7X5_9ASTR
MRRLNYTIARGNDDTLDKNVLRALNHLTLLGVVDAEALEIVSCASKICDYRGQLMRLRLDERYLSKGVHHRKLLAIVSRDRYGYVKNHKKTVKHGQARTRESEEYKKKPKIQSRSQKSRTYSQIHCFGPRDLVRLVVRSSSTALDLCDNGGEFRNKEMEDFCSRKGIKREFSNARTPQQNGVAERRNRTLIEATRTMLADAKLPVTFWAEAQYGDYTSTFLSQEEPQKISEALKDSSWVEAMQEELLQFQIQNVWVLVDCPKGVRPIGTKWVLKNKKDGRGIVIRNKARLVAQVHTQEGVLIMKKSLHQLQGLGLLGMDKSKITRKQSKASRHGHENQKSTKPKPEKPKSLAHFSFMKPQGPILLLPKLL